MSKRRKKTNTDDFIKKSIMLNAPNQFQSWWGKPGCEVCQNFVHKLCEVIADRYMSMSESERDPDGTVELFGNTDAIKAVHGVVWTLDFIMDTDFTNNFDCGACGYTPAKRVTGSEDEP